MIERLLTSNPDACAVGSVYSNPLVQSLLGGSLHPGGEELTAELARRAGLAPGMRVLDFGCGNGLAATGLARRFGCSVVGLDPSEDNVIAARRRAEHEGIGALSKFELLDVSEPAAWGAGYDAVLTECTLCLNQDPRETLQALHDALRPGGLLMLSDVAVEQAAESFRSAAGFIACLGGAVPYLDLIKMVREAGFDVTYADNRPDLVREVRDRIRSRVDVEAVLAALGPEAKSLERLAQEAESALAAGHLGYAVMVARRP